MNLDLYSGLPYTSNYDAFIETLINTNETDRHYSWNRGIKGGKNIQLMRLQRLLLHYNLSLAVFHRMIEFDKEQTYDKKLLYPLIIEAVKVAHSIEDGRLREVYVLVYAALIRASFSEETVDSVVDREKLRKDAEELTSLIIRTVDNPPLEVTMQKVVAVLNMEMAERNITLSALRKKLENKDYKHMRLILKGRQDSCGDMQIMLLSATLDTLPSSIYKRASEITGPVDEAGTLKEPVPGYCRQNTNS